MCLPACLYVHHMSAWCMQRLQEDIKSQTKIHWQKQQEILTIELFLQPCNLFF